MRVWRMSLRRTKSTIISWYGWIFRVFQHYRRSCHTKALAFTVSVMTFWKTVLYIAMFFELAGGKDYRQGNSLVQEIFIVYLTNGAWILFPYLCMASLWKELVPGDREKSVDNGYVEVKTSHGLMGDHARQRKLLWCGLVFWRQSIFSVL